MDAAKHVLFVKILTEKYVFVIEVKCPMQPVVCSYHFEGKALLGLLIKDVRRMMYVIHYGHGILNPLTASGI